MNKLSDELANAWLSKTQIDLNNFDKNEIPSSREEAYEALNLFYKKIKQKTVGWKIGAVAKKVQIEEGFDGPVPGKIFENTILHSKCEINYKEIPFSNIECEYAFKFDQDYKINDDLVNNLENIKLFTAIDITSSRYEQNSKSSFNKLTQMYLGIADHGNGGKIIIGNEIKNWININVNKIKIKLNINNQITEPFFTGEKRIDPRFSLKAFVDEFKDKDIAFKKGDYLLCGSLIQPYNIKEKDHININYENLGKFEIKII